MTEESISFDRLAKVYDATRGGEQRGVDFANNLAKLVLPGPVLEVGVGTGVVAAPFSAIIGRPVAGADVSPAMVDIARARLGDVVRVADGDSLPFEDQAFNTVFSVWVLQLVPDLLRHFARVAQPVINAMRSLPNPDQPRQRAVRHTCMAFDVVQPELNYGWASGMLFERDEALRMLSISSSAEPIADNSAVFVTNDKAPRSVNFCN